ncbi:MAG: creatininase family protein [Hyphomicrobiales bacterium]|nr:creatininase family protein [Hyphomicrobiales bacterium]MBV8824397.1 creatininase family protein [Hyphomicrobiales bacterium]
MIRYGDLTSEETEKQLASRILFLPIGTIEQHGPHLPLSVDVDISTAVAERLAEILAGIAAPSINYASRSLPQSGGGHVFPGTIHVRGSALVDYFVDVLACFLHWGAAKIVIINGHYENESFLFEALELLRERNLLRGVNMLALSWWSAIDAAFIQRHLGDQFFGWHAEHAGIVETSLMLHLRPETVRQIRVDNPRPPPAGVYRHPPSQEATGYRGVLSSTSAATAEFGRPLLEHICENIAAMLLKD